MFKKEIGVYIHIPFCESKCIYCDFNSVVADSKVVGEYVDALALSIIHFAENNDIKSFKATSVYFGGGTPSHINKEYISQILDTVRKHFDVACDAEITIELNPKSASKDKIIYYKDCGVNRISFGAQSFDDADLKWLNRPHLSTDIYVTAELIAKYFNNFSLDLIFGLKNQTEKDLLLNLNKATSLKPTHISVYGLSVETGTKLDSLVEKGLILPSGDEQASMYELLQNTLEEKGYAQYEISNFCINEKYSNHNMKYWLGKDYIGFGVSSHSLYVGNRYKCCESIGQFIDNSKRNISQLIKIEQLNAEEKLKEFIMLRLRTSFGINFLEIKELFNIDFLERYKKQVISLKSFLEISDKMIAIKAKHFFISNAIIEKFL